MIVLGAIIVIILGYFGLKSYIYSQKKKKLNLKCLWQKNILVRDSLKLAFKWKMVTILVFWPLSMIMEYQIG